MHDLLRIAIDEIAIGRDHMLIFAIDWVQVQWCFIGDGREHVNHNPLEALDTHSIKVLDDRHRHDISLCHRCVCGFKVAVLMDGIVLGNK